VRALVRAGSRVDQLDVEPVTGDLRDADSLRRAVAGCGLVFHVATDYRLWGEGPAELYQSNVDAPAICSRRPGRPVWSVWSTPARWLYRSASGGIGDEDSPVSCKEMAGDYKRSKFLAEQVALDFARGRHARGDCQSHGALGDHDVKPTPTGKIVLDFLNGDMPAFTDTGLNVVDVRDTAEGHWLACEHGRPGERYILVRRTSRWRRFCNNWRGLQAAALPPRGCVCGCLVRGRVQYGLGQRHGDAPRIPWKPSHGQEEDVGDHAKAARRTGFPTRAGRQGPGARVEWFQAAGNGRADAGGMKLLLVASDPMEFQGLLRRAVNARPAGLADCVAVYCFFIVFVTNWSRCGGGGVRRY